MGKKSGVPIRTLGCDIIIKGGNVYELIPEIHKALFSTGQTGKTLKNDTGILMMNNFWKHLDYTCNAEKLSKHKLFLSKVIPEKVAEFDSRFVDEEITDDLQGEGMKIIMPCNITDIYTRLETLLRIKLTGHSNTLT